jgi:hypothetical protein
MEKTAQGSISYLLLIGGAILIASVALLLMSNIGSTGTNVVETGKLRVLSGFQELTNLTGEKKAIGESCNSNSECESGYCQIPPGQCAEEPDPNNCGNSVCDSALGETASTCPQDCCNSDCTDKGDNTTCNQNCFNSGECGSFYSVAHLQSKGSRLCQTSTAVIEACNTPIQACDFMFECVSGSCVDKRPPAAPNVLSVVPGENSVTISWSAPTTDEGGWPLTGLQGYKVYYGLTSNPKNYATPITTSNTSIQVNGLTGGTLYFFDLTSFDPNNNETSEAVHLSVTPLESDETSCSDSENPNSVADLSIDSLTDSSITVSWTAPSDLPENESVSSYDLRYCIECNIETEWDNAISAGGPSVPASPGSPETFTINNLTANTQYFIALKSSDECGNISGISNIVSATTLPDSQPPEAPENLSGYASTDSSIQLSWNAVLEPDIDHYNIFMCEGDNSVCIDLENDFSLYGTTSNTIAQVSGLASNTFYSFFVTAVDTSNNESSESNVVEVKTLSGLGDSCEDSSDCFKLVCCVSETDKVCAMECLGPPLEAECGDGICDDPPENSDNCPTDCGYAP